jgi:hypothetical protein
MTARVDTNGPLFGGAPTWHLLDLLRARLNNIAILYVSVDRVHEVDPRVQVPAKRAHTDTSMAFFRVTNRETTGRMNRTARERPIGRQQYRQFAAPVLEFRGWPWVIDPREVSWPETTSSIVAKDMTRFSNGLTTSPKKTRLWFQDLAAALVASAWPWMNVWAESDLHRALQGQRIEVVADYIQQQGLVDLGAALLLWEYRKDDDDPGTRAEAAVGVFKAAEPIRLAARKLATQARVEIDAHRTAHFHWAYNQHRRGPEPMFAESERVQELRRELLAFGAGVPLPRVASVECCTADQRA